VGGVGASEAVINSEARSTNIAWLGFKPETQILWEKLSNVVAEVNRQFFHLDITGLYEPIQLCVYSEKNKDHYDWHIDGSPKDVSVPRKLSMALLLSDPSEFEGGEFQVKTNSDMVQTLEIKKGRAWFFPAYTLHKVTPVTKGVRRSLVLWAGGPAFR
jgi:PKHD-type hydroxylase